VIIDTDGGIDGIRAITMLLASPDVRKNSIKYWMNLDRHDIFTIESLLTKGR
jgi:hypothetical protein